MANDRWRCGACEKDNPQADLRCECGAPRPTAIPDEPERDPEVCTFTLVRVGECAMCKSVDVPVVSMGNDRKFYARLCRRCIGHLHRAVNVDLPEFDMVTMEIVL